MGLSEPRRGIFKNQIVNDAKQGKQIGNVGIDQHLCFKIRHGIILFLNTYISKQEILCI